jgi:hypothetical protein
MKAAYLAGQQKMRASILEIIDIEVAKLAVAGSDPTRNTTERVLDHCFVEKISELREVIVSLTTLIPF